MRGINLSLRRLLSRTLPSPWLASRAGAAAGGGGAAAVAAEAMRERDGKKAGFEINLKRKKKTDASSIFFSFLFADGKLGVEMPSTAAR